jgi:hypothetical protein
MSAWRLVRKLANLQEQQALIQRDREQLLMTVTYTKSHAQHITGMVHAMNEHMSQMKGQVCA